MIIIFAIAHFLLAASISGYYSKKEWQNWADKQILKKSDPSVWIIDVALSSTIEDLVECLSDMLIEEKYRFKEVYFSEAIIGYYYFMYSRNKIDLKELLLKSAEEAEEGVDIGSEPFYSIVDKLVQKPSSISKSDLCKEVEKLFSFFCKIAQEQEGILKEF